MTRPNITPYNEANVVADQPWLTLQEHEHMKQLGDAFTDQMRIGMEGWRLEHLKGRAAEGDQAAIKELHPLCHFVLTEDFRIVQEPNVVRWGMFMERGTHRFIDTTRICDGRERDRPSSEATWAWQQSRKRRRQDAPSFKIGQSCVSTVFLGHDRDELFETMIFGGWLDQTCWRSMTLGEAKQCHWQAVDLAHRLKRHIKRHGRSVRKDWVRLERFWRLARKRGAGWAEKKVSIMERVEQRLLEVPGRPCIPQPDFLMELAQMVLPRQQVGM